MIACSGWGLPNVYTFFKERGYAEESSWLTEQLAASDPMVVVINTALTANPPRALCTATLNTFISVLGAEAGDLALKLLATEGVYWGGAFLHASYRC